MSIESYALTNAERHAELGGKWLVSLGADRTRRSYGTDIRQWFAFLDALDLNALDADRAHADAFRVMLTGAQSTVARKIAAVSSFYRYAQSSGIVDTNPVALVVRPKVDADHSATRGLSKAEAVAFLEAAEQDSPRSHVVATLLIHTGIRISEALGANLRDLQHDTGHRVLVVTRKGGKRAKIALPAPVVDALSAYLGTAVAQGTEVAISDAESADAPIFTTTTGKRWVSSEAFRTVQRLARVAGIEGQVSPHGLRHTHATLALDAGVPLRDLQDSMGHADPRTTRRYDRARARLERSSSYAVASVLS